MLPGLCFASAIKNVHKCSKLETTRYYSAIHNPQLLGVHYRLHLNKQTNQKTKTDSFPKWINRDKYIKINTNMLSIGPVLHEIAPWVMRALCLIWICLNEKHLCTGCKKVPWPLSIRKIQRLKVAYRNLIHIWKLEICTFLVQTQPHW